MVELLQVTINKTYVFIEAVAFNIPQSEQCPHCLDKN